MNNNYLCCVLCMTVWVDSHTWPVLLILLLYLHAWKAPYATNCIASMWLSMCIQLWVLHSLLPLLLCTPGDMYTYQVTVWEAYRPWTVYAVKVCALRIGTVYYCFIHYLHTDIHHLLNTRLADNSEHHSWHCLSIHFAYSQSTTT